MFDEFAILCNDTVGASFVRKTGYRCRRENELSGNRDKRRGSPDSGGACDDHLAGVPNPVAGVDG
jgi:hypothetical protein